MSQNTNDKVSERMPGTEVVEKAKRRQYTAEYKLRIPFDPKTGQSAQLFSLLYIEISGRFTGRIRFGLINNISKKKTALCVITHRAFMH
jgi:hypothetical protein